MGRTDFSGRKHGKDRAEPSQAGGQPARGNGGFPGHDMSTTIGYEKRYNPFVKIGILFLDRDFEHDVYELTKAFYPEGEIVRLYEAEEPGEAYDVFFFG